MAGSDRERRKARPGAGSNWYNYEYNGIRLKCPKCDYEAGFRVRKPSKQVGLGTKVKCPKRGTVNRQKTLQKTYKEYYARLDDIRPPDRED